MHPEAGGAHLRFRPLAVDDAAAGGHPIDVARPDRLGIAQAVAMVDSAVEEVGHRRQADMRMGPHLHTAAGRHVHGTEMVEEDEGSDRAALDAGQHAADGEASPQIMSPPLDQ